MRKNKLFALLVSGLMAVSAMPVVSVSADERNIFDWASTAPTANWIADNRGGYYVEGCWCYWMGLDDEEQLTKSKSLAEIYLGLESLEEKYPLGDIDLDGIVTGHDAALLAKTFFVPSSVEDPVYDVELYSNELFQYALEEHSKDENYRETLGKFKAQKYLSDANSDYKITRADLEQIMENCEYQLGDVNMDGKVDMDDASMVLNEYSKIAAGLPSTFTEVQKNLADMTGVYYNTNPEKSNVETVDNASYILTRYALESVGLPSFDYNDSFHCYFE